MSLLGNLKVKENNTYILRTVQPNEVKSLVEKVQRVQKKFTEAFLDISNIYKAMTISNKKVAIFSGFALFILVARAISW